MASAPRAANVINTFISSVRTVRTAALVGSDLLGVRPAFEVDVGDSVSVGQTLFVDRRRPQLAFCAPISCRVSQLRRGPRRTLDLIAIEREDDDARVEEFRVPPLSDQEGLRRLLLDRDISDHRAWLDRQPDGHPTTTEATSRLEESPPSLDHRS